MQNDEGARDGSNPSDSLQNAISDRSAQTSSQQTTVTGDADGKRDEPQKSGWQSVPWDRRIELLIALAVATFAGFQYFSSCNNSQQTELLIRAAKINAHSTAHSAAAAQGFSLSAERIAESMGDAVTKLNTQATELTKSAAQTSRLATATELSNANIVLADRPWMGGYISVSNFDVGLKPVINFGFQNSGKRPARIEVMLSLGFFSPTFPSNIKQIMQVDASTASRGIVVPGSVFSNPNSVQGVVSLEDMELTKVGTKRYFAVASVQYSDLRTREQYWTHICTEYVPRDPNPYWRSCNEYNDAQ